MPDYDVYATVTVRAANEADAIGIVARRLAGAETINRVTKNRGETAIYPVVRFSIEERARVPKGWTKTNPKVGS